MYDHRDSILGDLIAHNEDNAGVQLIVDLAFATNVRFLDDHELHLDQVELYKVRSVKGGAKNG